MKKLLFCSIFIGQLIGLQNFNTPRAALDLIKPYLSENPIILEAGAYDGQDTIYMANFWPKSTVYAFEPVPEIHNWLIGRAGFYKNITTYKLALSDKNGEAMFYVSEFNSHPGTPSASSSLLEPKDHLIQAPHVLFPKKIQVNTVTIDSWAEQNNVDKIDFLWLDMQGYELNALIASPKILKTVKAILTEVEFTEAYSGQYLFADVKSWLENQGFTMIALHEECSWFGDALFVRL